MYNGNIIYHLLFSSENKNMKILRIATLALAVCALLSFAVLLMQKNTDDLPSNVVADDVPDRCVIRTNMMMYPSISNPQAI